MLSTIGDENKIREQILVLESEHEVLDRRLKCTEEKDGCMLDKQRMKRRKLKLKDAISYLRDSLREDIIA